MRPYAVVAVRLLQESRDLKQALDTLLTSYKLSIDPDHERHDSKTASAQGSDVVLTGKIFACHTGDRVCALPVIVKAGLLDHREQLVVAHRAGGGTRDGGRSRFVP